jgi:hypothetical protein
MLQLAKTFIKLQGEAEIAASNNKEAPIKFCNRYNLINTEARQKMEIFTLLLL